jgi:hypothetical protein
MHLITFFDGHAVHVPACPSCGWKIHAHAWWRWVITVLVIVVVVWLGSDLVAWMPRPIRKWALLGAAILALLPWFAWQLCFPLQFEMTVSAHEVTYQFRDKRYAAQFAMLNYADVIQMDEDILDGSSYPPIEDAVADTADPNPYRDLNDPRFGS